MTQAYLYKKKELILLLKGADWHFKLEDELPLFWIRSNIHKLLDDGPLTETIIAKIDEVVKERTQI